MKRKVPNLSCLCSCILCVFLICSCTGPARENKQKQTTNSIMGLFDDDEDDENGIDDYDFDFSSLKSRRVIRSAERVIEKVEATFDELTDAQWRKADSRMEELRKEFQSIRETMAEEEQEYFNSLIGNYLALRAKKFGREMERTIKDTKDAAKGFIDKISR